MEQLNEGVDIKPASYKCRMVFIWSLAAIVLGACGATFHIFYQQKKTLREKRSMPSGVGMSRGQKEAARRNSVAGEVGQMLPWLEDQKNFLISPDVKSIMLKHSLTPDKSYMEVRDIATNTEIGRHVGGYPLLVTFVQEENKLSFVKDQGGNLSFQLFLWEPRTGEVTIAEVPRAWIAADRLMYSSPNGKYLAFRAKLSGAYDSLQIVDIKTGKARSLVDSLKISAISWSQNSKKIAAIVSNPSPRIRIFDADSGATKDVILSQGVLPSQISWGDEAIIFAAARQAGAHNYELRAVNLESGESRVVSLPHDNVSQPEALSDGQFIYHLKRGGLIKAMIGDIKGTVKALIEDPGTTRYLAYDKTRREVYVEHTGLIEPKGLYRIGVDTNTLTAVYTTARTVRPIAERTRPARLSVKVNGINLGATLWRSSALDPKGAILKFPTIRRENAPMSYDGRIDYLTKEGYHYISFDAYEGEQRPYVTDDYSFTANDNADAGALVTYIAKSLNIDTAKIILFGESNGARFVVESLNYLKTKDCAVVLRGVAQNYPRVTLGRDHSFKLAVLQGENDETTLEEAKPGILRLFGSETYENAFFWELKGEGHTPKMLSSKATVGAVLAHVKDW